MSGAYLPILFLALFGYANLVEGQPNDDGVYHLIEGVYYLSHQKQPARAIPFFQKAIAFDPDNPEPYYFLGVSYYRLGRSTAAVLFYLYEAEKRGMQYDQFRFNLIPEIEKKFPGVQPAAPAASTGAREAQIIVESKRFSEAIVVVEDEKERTEYYLGEQIPLEGGKRYTIRLKKKGIGSLLTKLLLAASVVGIWVLR